MGPRKKVSTAGREAGEGGQGGTVRRQEGGVQRAGDAGPGRDDGRGPEAAAEAAGEGRGERGQRSQFEAVTI